MKISNAGMLKTLKIVNNKLLVSINSEYYLELTVVSDVGLLNGLEDIRYLAKDYGILPHNSIYTLHGRKSVIKK